MISTDRPPTKPAEMTLQEAKEVTQAIKDNFDSLGAMLMQARDRKAYKSLGYKSFEGYCNSEFGKSVSRAYQLIEDHKLVQQISERLSERLEEKITIKIPSSYLKPLKILDNTDQQIDAIEYANHIADKEKRKTTKADLELATYKISGKKSVDFKRAIEAKGFKKGAQVELISTKDRGVITNVNSQGKIYVRSNGSKSMTGIPYDRADLRILEPSEYPKIPASENEPYNTKVKIFSRGFEGREGFIITANPGRIALVRLATGGAQTFPYAELEVVDTDVADVVDVTPQIEIIEIESTELNSLRTRLAAEVSTNHGLRQQIELLEKQNKELCDRLLSAEKTGKALGISFGKTLNELLSGRKTQTRRSWQNDYAKNFIRYWEEGIEIPALDKQRQYGGREIGRIKLTERPYKEFISQMPLSDLEKEGGMCTTVQEFIDKFFDGKDQLVWVLNFEYVASAEESGIATVVAERDASIEREKILEEQLEEAKRAIEEMVAGLKVAALVTIEPEETVARAESWTDLLNHFGFSKVTEGSCDTGEQIDEHRGWKIGIDSGGYIINLLHSDRGFFSRYKETNSSTDVILAWTKNCINEIEDFCPGQLSLFAPKPTVATFEETFSSELLERVEAKKQRLLHDINQATESNRTIGKKPKDIKNTDNFIIRVQEQIKSLDKFLKFRIGQNVYLTNKIERTLGEIKGVALSTGGVPSVFVAWPEQASSTPEMVTFLALAED